MGSLFHLTLRNFFSLNNLNLNPNPNPNPNQILTDFESETSSETKTLEKFFPILRSFEFISLRDYE